MTGQLPSLYQAMQTRLWHYWRRLTPEPVPSPIGKLWLVYWRQNVFLREAGRTLKRLCKPSTFGHERTQQLSSSPSLLMFASGYINMAEQSLFLKKVSVTRCNDVRNLSHNAMARQVSWHIATCNTPRCHEAVSALVARQVSPKVEKFQLYATIASSWYWHCTVSHLSLNRFHNAMPDRFRKPLHRVILAYIRISPLK